MRAFQWSNFSASALRDWIAANCHLLQARSSNQFMQELPVSCSDHLLQRRQLPVADDSGRSEVAVILHAGAPPQVVSSVWARLS